MSIKGFRKNQIFFVIVAVLVEYHLPHLSLSPAYASSLMLAPIVTVERAVEADRIAPYASRDPLPKKPARLVGVRLNGVPGKRVAVVPKNRPVSRRTVTMTAYSSTKDQTDATPCITANGYNVCKHGSENVIAANFLPFGTRVQFPELFGDREFIVQDRMNRRYTNRVDVWMKSRGSAKQFGIKHSVTMVVVAPTTIQKKEQKLPSTTQVAVNF